MDNLIKMNYSKINTKNIPTIILCGGMGTRMREETEYKPKPMVLIGGKPMLWHIMKIYSYYGYNNFILALGYKGEMIKDYFLNFKTFINDFELETSTNNINYCNGLEDNFKILFAETGLESATGERILRVKKYLKNDLFMLTYGDGVSDIDINKLVDFHLKQKTLGTITGVHPFSKYGMIKIDKKKKLVIDFEQKPLMFDYVNGGFMVFHKKALKYFDKGPMENGLKKMAKDKQLSVYCYDGFWKAMDTYREMEELNKLWEEKKPWAVWEKKKN
ncbi:MAG TPA: sugar phosphate nucleotidyltransferase [Candidatus Paceibacterota bacterium]|nr:sugar phosphate nucleotidyltransferase [Candidatus Paceibacterota bacterium]